MRASTANRVALGLALAASIAGAGAAGAAAPAPVEYLYVEANEGGSSGGHVALRLGDSVFHFQQQDDWLVLLRDDVRDFFHEYVLAGNRTVHALRLELADYTAALLLARFEARQRAESRQREWLEALRADRRLLDAQLGDGEPHARAGPERESVLAVPGAGFFEAKPPAPERRDRRLLALRARVEARYGAGFVDARLVALRAQRARLAPQPMPPLPSLDAMSLPPLVDSYARRHADLVAAESALAVLRDAPGLAGGAAFALPGAPLTQPERTRLCASGEPLSQELVDLAGGSRPDWGVAFLLGAARLLALADGCERGALLVLEAYDGSEPDAVAAPQPAALALLTRDAERAALEARLRFLSGPWSEPRLSDLESSANRAAELARVAREGGPLRLPPGRLVPRRPAVRVALAPAPVSRPRLLAVRALARQRESEAARRLSALHVYRLLTHNCVTEIFRTIDAAFGDSREEIELRLGGFVDPVAYGHFVPFVSARAVRAAYRVAEERTIPSLRIARARRLAASEGWIATSLRELSPLSARAYASATADSGFLFFSDGASALRPLLGAANLLAGAGETLVGVLRAPADGGSRLSAGLRGVFWSVPELFFFSVRKGTNEYVPPEWQDWLDAQIAPAS